MPPHRVAFLLTGPSKCGVAVFTREGLLPAVNGHVAFQVTGRCEGRAAFQTRERPCPKVSFHMFTQVTKLCEGSATFADKWHFFSSHRYAIGHGPRKWKNFTQGPAVSEHFTLRLLSRTTTGPTDPSTL